MLLICGMRLPAFFLPYSRRDFGKVGVHLRGFCIHFGQAEGICKGECLAINTCTADDVDVFVGLAAEPRCGDWEARLWGAIQRSFGP